MFPRISAVPWPVVDGAVSAHLPKKRWLDWAQILWTISLWASPGLIKFRSRSTEFPPFPVSCWSGSFHAFEDKLLIRLGSNIMCQLITNLPRSDLILVTPHWISTAPCPLIGWAVFADLQKNRWSDEAQNGWANSLCASPGMTTFWSCSTVFLLFLAFYWSASFRGFSDKPLVQLGPQWVGQLMIDPPGADWLLVMFHWVSGVFFASDWSACSTHLQTNCWWDKAENGWQSHHGLQTWLTVGLC